MDYKSGYLITYIDLLIRTTIVKDKDGELSLTELTDKSEHYSISSKNRKKALSQMKNKLEEIK